MEDGKVSFDRYVLFRVFGSELQPSEITARLQREPSFAYARGELHTKTGRPRSIGMWQISSRHQIESDELEIHMSWILDQLEPLKAVVQEISSQEGFQADLNRQRPGGASPATRPSGCVVHTACVRRACHSV